jgi:hypothetical protein
MIDAANHSGILPRLFPDGSLVQHVADPQQRDDFVALSEQDALHLLFYDEQLHHQLNKRVALKDQVKLRGMLVIAQELRHAIAEDVYDFDVAKNAVMERNPL